MVDITTVTFLSTVTLIRLAVYFFSQSYISAEKFSSRFHLLLALFILSIIILIVRPSLFSGLLGWDGLGITSFLLVIYYSNSKAFGASLLTAIRNRVGDALILAALGLLACSPSLLISLLAPVGASIPQLLITLIIIAACTKSAQIPFRA